MSARDAHTPANASGTPDGVTAHPAPESVSAAPTGRPGADWIATAPVEGRGVAFTEPYGGQTLLVNVRRSVLDGVLLVEIETDEIDARDTRMRVVVNDGHLVAADDSGREYIEIV